ncbi:hypothetical protein B296_00018724 [Ensete ventricosum]|uniref:Uncharacterized protein n=1 Tax=Ensete ventricosum TaxID=4639 RepID=A0A427B1E6_ENSVE|nr:hypothetical protein B296_00018724 [Ensete ventricosum]
MDGPRSAVLACRTVEDPSSSEAANRGKKKTSRSKRLAIVGNDLDRHSPRSSAFPAPSAASSIADVGSATGVTSTPHASFLVPDKFSRAFKLPKGSQTSSQELLSSRKAFNPKQLQRAFNPKQLPKVSQSQYRFRAFYQFSIPNGLCRSSCSNQLPALNDSQRNSSFEQPPKGYLHTLNQQKSSFPNTTFDSVIHTHSASRLVHADFKSWPAPLASSLSRLYRLGLLASPCRFQVSASLVGFKSRSVISTRPLGQSMLTSSLGHPRRLQVSANHAYFKSQPVHIDSASQPVHAGFKSRPVHTDSASRPVHAPASSPGQSCRLQVSTSSYRLGLSASPHRLQVSASHADFKSRPIISTRPLGQPMSTSSPDQSCRLRFRPES